MSEIESHPLQPFVPNNTKLLMLGSFPPPKSRWCMEFFYPNFINDMWRIVGLIFFGDKNHFVVTSEKRFDQHAIIEFCQTHGIAIFDTAQAVRRLRDNASDKYLEVVIETELSQLLQNASLCKAIATTGEKATDTIVAKYGCQKPKIGYSESIIIENRTLEFYRMPSSSRAYPLALDKKAEIYKSMFSKIGLI